VFPQFCWKRGCISALSVSDSFQSKVYHFSRKFSGNLTQPRGFSSKIASKFPATPGIDSLRRRADLSVLFGQSFNASAECVVLGAYDREREVYCPSVLYFPFSLLLNVPYFRPVLEKVVAYYTDVRY
jgi:hypothetical protein